MFGLTFEKLLLIGVLAAFLIGPDKLPYYAAKLAELVKSVRRFADGAKEKMREEMGPEFDDIDWKKLDPRQYDPRQIIRTALLEDDDASSPNPDPNPEPPFVKPTLVKAKPHSHPVIKPASEAIADSVKAAETLAEDVNK